MTSEEIKNRIREKHGTLSAAAVAYRTDIHNLSNIVRKCSRSRRVEDLIAADCGKPAGELFEWRSDKKVASTA